MTTNFSRRYGAALAAVFCALTSTAAAEDALTEASTKPTTPAEATPAQPAPAKIASVVAPDEQPGWGDIVHVQRDFGSWALNCDTRLSTNKRVCFLEQRLSDASASLSWRLMTTDDNRTVVVIAAPKTLDAAQGIRMKFGLEKTIGSFKCGSLCIAVEPFDGAFQSAVLQAKSVSFDFTVTADGKSAPVKLSASMQGLAEAIEAARIDPFGKAAQVKTAAASNPKTAKAEKPKKAQRPKVQDKVTEARTLPETKETADGLY